MQVPPWQSAAQVCSVLQVTEQSMSSPFGVQLRVHGPGSQLGVQVWPEASQLKLQLVPEQLVMQSVSPVHPTRHSWEPQTGSHPAPVPGQMGVPASATAFDPTTSSTVQAIPS